MQEETSGVVRVPSGDRRLSLRRLRVHYGHVQMGQRTKAGCCSVDSGLEGVTEEIYIEEPAVVESPGTDEERDDPLPPNSGTNPWEA